MVIVGVGVIDEPFLPFALLFCVKPITAIDIKENASAAIPKVVLFIIQSLLNSFSLKNSFKNKKQFMNVFPKSNNRALAERLGITRKNSRRAGVLHKSDARGGVSKNDRRRF